MTDRTDYHRTAVRLVSEGGARPRIPDGVEWVIDVERGGLGVRFGDGVDAVVAVLGKPDTIVVEEGGDEISLEYGSTLHCEFVDNELRELQFSSELGVSLQGGPEFGATREQAIEVLGRPALDAPPGPEGALGFEGIVFRLRGRDLFLTFQENRLRDVKISAHRPQP